MEAKPSFFLNLLLVILFTYGVFYTSYKFGRPDLGNHDFVKYEKMIDSPLNLSATRAPFVLRQLPTTIAAVLKNAGIYYPNLVSFKDSVYYKGEDSQRTLFALILSNYLAVVVGLALLTGYLQKQTGSKDVLFKVMALSLGYFMLQLNIIAPLTQGYGWLAAILLSIGLLDKRYPLLLAGTFIGLFSRETVVLFFMVFAGGYAFYCYRRKVETRFYRNAVLIFFCSLLLLMGLRVGFTTGNTAQLSPLYLLKETIGAVFSADYLFQAIFTQGLLVYLYIHLYRTAKPLALAYGAALLVILLIGGFGVGRIIGESYPLLVLLYCLPQEKTARYLYR